MKKYDLEGDKEILISEFAGSFVFTSGLMLSYGLPEE